jgi:hypothetical protein
VAEIFYQASHISKVLAMLKCSAGSGQKKWRRLGEKSLNKHVAQFEGKS